MLNILFKVCRFFFSFLSTGIKIKIVDKEYADVCRKQENRRKLFFLSKYIN